jgi:tyrosinase
LSREKKWHPVIRWYERGIHELKQIDDVSNPRSWIYLANIHGTFSPRRDWPSGLGDRAWNACQHGSWYFLPWHRMYLHHLEKILRATIVKLGGPDDWALPFWNYDPEHPKTLALPPAFIEAKTPDDRPNALFVRRRAQVMKDGGRVDADDVETSGWADRFTADSIVIPTFGGPKTGWAHNGPAFGQLELEPHGMVHVDVGGTDGDPTTGGFMSFFELAARDPIFWLHHANIDRLWEVWRNQTGHRNPSSRDWRNREFVFGSGNWRTSLAVKDVIDTTAAPFRYRYEGVPVPEVSETTRRRTPELAHSQDEEEPMEEEIPPELVGTSDTKIPLGKKPTTVGVKLGPPKGPAARGAGAVDAEPSRRVYLTLENVTATTLGAGTYVIHINAPAGSDPRSNRDRRAGKISTFGLVEASRTDEVHSGSGATFSFEITDIVERLGADDDWDPAEIRVTITPKGDDAGGPEGAVYIGRVGVYYG